MGPPWDGKRGQFNERLPDSTWGRPRWNWLKPWLLLAPFLCYSCQCGTQSKIGKPVESWQCWWKHRDEVSVLIFTGSIGQPGADHHSSWPSSCHLLWIIFLGYSLKIILQICIYFWGIFNLVRVSTFEFSCGTWHSIESVLLKWRQG